MSCMKKMILAALAAFACSILASAQYRTDLIELQMSETQLRMKEQIQYLSSAALEGRLAGSEGEKLAAEYVAGQLAGYGVELLGGSDAGVFGLKQASGDTLTSHNVIGCIPGYDKQLREHYIVIGARLDNLGTSVVTVDGAQVEKIYYGANGNASGLSMMLQLARKLSENSVTLRRSVIFAAFGASRISGAGAWYFLNRSFPGAGEIDAMVNLDMLGTGSRGFYAYTASNADLNSLISTMAETLQPIQPKLVSLEPVESDHRIFYDKEIPSVLFTTGMYPEYRTVSDTESIIEYDDCERELEYLYNFCTALVNGARPEFRPSDQTKQKHSAHKDVYPYYDCDSKPTFLGSSDPMNFLRKWVYVYLKYPRAAVQEGVQGKVLVDFVIDERGKVTDVKVLRGVNPLIDAEAVRVVQASPDWKPARMGGEKVKSEMSLWIEFRLAKKK